LCPPSQHPTQSPSPTHTTLRRLLTTRLSRPIWPCVKLESDTAMRV
jgi:hypothetical protein